MVDFSVIPDGLSMVASNKNESFIEDIFFF